MRFAYAFGMDHLSITPEDLAGLRTLFTDEEVIELGMLCAQFLGFGRLVKVLGMELGMTCAIPAHQSATATA